MASLAALPSNECDISSNAPADTCGKIASIGANGAVVVNDVNAPILGSRSMADSTAITPIDGYGYCRYVNNGSTNSIFVPFRTLLEWQAFIGNHPVGISLKDCARGGYAAIAPNFGTTAQTNQCASNPMAQPVAAPYMAYSNASPPTYLSSPPLIFNCQSEDGTSFVEAAVADLNGVDSGASEPNAGVIGWTIGNVLYTYNGECGASNGAAVTMAPTTGLCHVGVASSVVAVSNVDYGWTCSGGNGGGIAAACSTDTGEALTLAPVNSCDVCDTTPLHM